jgi:hypothetical protein
MGIREGGMGSEHGTLEAKVELEMFLRLSDTEPYEIDETLARDILVVCERSSERRDQIIELTRIARTWTAIAAAAILMTVIVVVIVSAGMV